MSARGVAGTESGGPAQKNSCRRWCLSSVNGEGWITPIALAEQLGVTPRRAQQIAQISVAGRKYRGVHLRVAIEKNRQARGGLAYWIDLSSIPSEWLAGDTPEISTEPTPLQALNEAQSVADRADRQPRPFLPGSSLAVWKLDLVNAILTRTEQGETLQSSITAVAAAAIVPAGSKAGRTVSPSTLARWVRQYQANGVQTLSRKRRGDKHQRRIRVSRAIDAVLVSIGLDDECLEQFAHRVRRDMATLWAKGATWRHVQHLAIPIVAKRLSEAGIATGEIEKGHLVQLCTLSRRAIERLRYYRIVHTTQTNAGLTAAKITPRIQRTRRNLLPMHAVAADVYHVDVLVRRDDGSTTTPKMIAWQDLATNRLFCTFHLPPPGESVRREHIAESFAEMCSHPQWGVPHQLIVDRGSEYSIWNDHIETLMALAQDVGAQHGISIAIEPGVKQALPYRPQSKFIEGKFSNLVRSYLPMFPGFIGGNRMKKVTANQGRAPEPFPGSFDDFKGAIQNLLAYYHTVPQRGALCGLSPNSSFEQHVANGWRAVVADPAQLMDVFAKVEQRTITRDGTFSLGGVSYGHELLRDVTLDRRVLVRVPFFGNKHSIGVFTRDDRFICRAAPVAIFDYGDRGGAGEQQRRASVQRKQIATLKSETNDHDVSDAMRDAVEFFDAPSSPEPLAQIGAGGAFGESAAAYAAATTSINEIEKAKRAAERAKIDALMAEHFPMPKRKRYADE